MTFLIYKVAARGHYYYTKKCVQKKKRDKINIVVRLVDLIRLTWNLKKISSVVMRNKSIKQTLSEREVLWL